jgi:23S rRNA pseudouridine1911/1915/1917 synthase
MKEFVIDADHVGLRADVFVATMYPQYARAALGKLFDGHNVLLNGEDTKLGYKLRLGDRISVDISLLEQEPDDIDLPVLYEDDNVVVINKPAGVLSHSKGAFNPEGTVSSFLRAHASLKEAGDRVGIVHRLDRGTSGVIICAKNTSAHQWLQKQFATRNVQKTYLAVVSGGFNEPEAVIDVAIERNPKQPQTFRVGSGGKTAQTHYKVLKTLENPTNSVVELKPTTGRTHQLRVHMSYLGHPIIGDTVYGGAPFSRMLLHAAKLEITLPGGEHKTFSAPLPEAFFTYYKG